MTDAEEGRFVAGTIFEQKMQNQMNNGDFAILYRTNAISFDGRRLEKIFPTAFMVDCLLPKERNKRCIVLLRLVINPKDEEALMRVINYPARGIGILRLKSC
jgi:DNA helicase-2/ATP-dependent DNA helicase PcrA